MFQKYSLLLCLFASEINEGFHQYIFNLALYFVVNLQSRFIIIFVFYIICRQPHNSHFKKFYDLLNASLLFKISLTYLMIFTGIYIFRRVNVKFLFQLLKNKTKSKKPLPFSEIETADFISLTTYLRIYIYIYNH